MKLKCGTYQKLIPLTLVCSISVTQVTWSLGVNGLAFAGDTKTPSKKKHDHDEHKSEDKHDHAEGKSEKKDDHKVEHQDEHADEHTDGHGDDHGDEHGDEHGHGKSEKKKDNHAHGEKDGHDDHEEEGSTRFGIGKAITAANKKEGIQLSEKASKALGLTHVTATGTGTFKLPAQSAVYFQNEVGVYRFKNGWYKLIEVTLVSKSATDVVVKTSEIKSGDQIAKDGVPLLRAAELEAWGGSGDGHGH